MTPKEITDHRFISILKHTDISKKGIEIAPYHHPILPKADGHDILILDVFDTDRLRLNAKKNPAFDEAEVAKVEPVDFVGDACDLGAIITKAGMAGQFGYVISSHNFEHLANPIKFFQGVGVALEAGGVLSMAVPDYRLCFDKFRVPTRLSDWLVAYHSDKKQPAPADIFDQSMGSTRMPDSSPYIVALENPSPPKPYLTLMNFRDQYQVFCEKLKTPGPYQDTHCSAVFPEMLELYLRDLRHLGLIDLELIDSPEQNAGEFFVYLKKVATPSQTSDEDHCKVRESLLRRVSEQIGNGGFVRENSKEIEPTTLPNKIEPITLPNKIEPITLLNKIDEIGVKIDKIDEIDVKINKIDEIDVKIERMNTIITRIERRGILAFFQRKNRKRLARLRAKIDTKNKQGQ